LVGAGGFVFPTGGNPATGGESSTGGRQGTGGGSTGETYSGEGTYFTPNNAGACGYGSQYQGRNIAALNGPQYGASNSQSPNCGRCVNVTGPKGSATQVVIIDVCPECAQGDLDFDLATFELIADQIDGRVAITWSFVDCAQ
jgi:expansin (peptidoglycan-binding protein)